MSDDRVIDELKQIQRLLLELVRLETMANHMVAESVAPLKAMTAAIEAKSKVDSQLDRIIRELGGVTAVARICEVKPPSVCEWVQRGRIPATRCEQIELATGGAMRCEQLRPDLEWIRDPQGKPYSRKRVAA
jgi:DNA-binding transcriptional regulator YdaS (Cro superfamily)